MKGKIALMSLVLLLFNACKKSSDFQSKLVNPILIGRGDIHNEGDLVFEPQNTAITSAVVWEDFLTKIDPLLLDGTLVGTDIDFEENIVIALFDEVYTTTGTSIEISSIVEEEDFVVIRIVQGVAGTYGCTLQCQPFYIVKIPRIDKPLAFEL